MPVCQLRIRIVISLCVATFIPEVYATARYYSTQFTFGTGDNMVQGFHAHGGTLHPLRKWIAECMDGEALVGLQDTGDDYTKANFLWCRFTFVHKPPSQGRYPYYPTCHVRNMTDQWYCFDVQNAERTINTFITGMWDNEANFYFHRRNNPTIPIQYDAFQPYKCCKTPPGYYIDYLSCYYLPTHDPYFEYYDSQFHNIIFCSRGYVATGWSKKLNPDGDWHMDWLQCCRVGYGPPAGAPPTIEAQSGMPTYDGNNANIPSGYRHQYRRSLPDADVRAVSGEGDEHLNMSFAQSTARTFVTESMRYKREPIPEAYRPGSSTGMSARNLPVGCDSSHVITR